MKRVIKYALLCTSVFTASAIYHLPASVALSFSPLPQGVFIDGAEGTVWQGRAQNVRFQNYQLGELNWSFSWSSLLTLSPEYAVRFGRGSALGLSGKGNVGISFSGPYVETLLASISADTVLQYSPMPVPVSAGGQLELAIKSLQYQSPWCGTGEGSLSWSAGYIETPVGSLSFGPTIVDLACNDSVLTAKGSQSSKQVSSEFSGQLTPNRQYQSSAWFKPEGDFPATMRQQLSWLGNPDNQGRYSFNYQGRF
ncbi:type II secretion system protein N [Vibrio mediterranei]|uniref:type II secretion system protein N n=1 Tax=Vibrio mediterranei TaxID=689 RepID=UPI00148E1FB0|nr:type II secretion system protein N [Vibrio mediterranei]NOH29348.1 type II secretion system protein N [Vibrio mediterranei]